MALTIQELAGLGAADENPAQTVPRKAKAAIDAYVSCLQSKGLASAFYLQDPRQEVVTEAHRRGDPCYPLLNPGIYVAAKEVARWHLGASLSDAGVAKLFADAKARRGAEVDGQTLSAEDVDSLVQEAVSLVELEAEQQASARVGRVRAIKTTPSPLEVGATAYKQRVLQQQQQVEAGKAVRVLKREDVITPEEQRRIAADTARRAAAQAAARGPLVSCPPGVSIEQCVAEARRRAEDQRERPFPWLAAGIGLIAFVGILSFSLAGGRSSASP